MICSAQNYTTSEGFTIDSATGAFLVTGQPVAPTWKNSKGLTIDATGAVVVALAGSGTTLYQESSAGTTTNSNNSADVNMFTGYTLPANTLTAGHRLVINACFKHTTGATSTTHKFVIGGVATTLFGASTAVTQVCVTEIVYATDATHQYIMQPTTSNPVPTLVTPLGPTALTLNLASNQAINFVQNAAGTADVYTAYEITVDLY